MSSTVFSIVISLVALCVSIFTLWRNYLSPFRLWVANDSPTFALYRVHQWWIPSIDVGFSFGNLGSRSGWITDIRIIGELAQKDTRTIYPFDARWIVDYGKF